LSDDDLVAAHRVFTAMITAMASFEQDVINPAPNSSENSDRRSAAARRRQRTPQ
jgi:hypothetical protein